jgi:hypothetical protein
MHNSAVAVFKPDKIGESVGIHGGDEAFGRVCATIGNMGVKCAGETITLLRNCALKTPETRTIAASATLKLSDSVS